MITTSRRAELTFRGNRGVARHGWIRLTPAYGVALVERELTHHDNSRVLLDPFGGTGTTALCGATAGHEAHVVDLNPFLVWLAKTKTRHYTDEDVMHALALAQDIAVAAWDVWRDATLWQPPLSNIERWWSPSALAALRALRAACDATLDGDAASDLILIAFCQTLIDYSAAAFNHQSMSFKAHRHTDVRPEAARVKHVIDDFGSRALAVVEECEPNPPGAVYVHKGEARALAEVVKEPVDLLVTSPPYCNRMSYIRELRPYMYWLRYLTDAREAGELDWQAIGGTWGVATARLMTVELGEPPPLASDFTDTITAIAQTPNERNARLLSNYVLKYFSDVWQHIKSTVDVMAAGGRLVYIVGNSTFFKHMVPIERWYAELLSMAGYVDVQIKTVRKRNSNKLLYEYEVTATKAHPGYGTGVEQASTSRAVDEALSLVPARSLARLDDEQARSHRSDPRDDADSDGGQMSFLSPGYQEPANHP